MAATFEEKFVTNSKGKTVSVILSYRDYRKLMEDLHDLAIIAERRDEKPISLEAMKKKLQKDGLL
jgi:hypothetical protein